MGYEQFPLFYNPKREPQKRESRKILDREAAHADTEDAVVRASYLSDDDRKDEMLAAIERVARKFLYFTVDQVWDELGEVGYESDNGSGLGPVMRMAVRARIIENTGGFRRSDRAPRHGNWMRLWKSLIYQGEGNGRPKDGDTK